MTFDGHIEAQVVIPAGGAAVSATNGAGGPTTCTVPAGSYFISALCVALQAALIASRPPSSGTWLVTVSSTGAAATGKVHITCTQSSGTWGITWTSTTLRDVLGFASDIVGAAASSDQVGANQSPMLWFPDCPLNCDGDPKTAATVTDLRSMQTPRGDVFSLVGNAFYRKRNVRWEQVAIARVWAAESATNASWETFLLNTQLGQGAISWFGPSSRVNIYDHRGNALGVDRSISSWKIVGLTEVDPKQSIANYTGLWRIELPVLLSSG